MEIKDIIRQKRKEKGLTTTELGKLVGVNNGTISRWERGEIASIKQSKIALLANALGISPVLLIRADNTPADYHRTTDIGLRQAYFIEELVTRSDAFYLDGIELDKEDVNTVVTLLEQNLELCKRLIKTKHQK